MDDKIMKTTPIKKELSYDPKVIKKIAGIATDDVPGVLTVSGGLIGNLTDRLRSDDKTKGISVDVGKRQVALDLTVVCEYGRNVPALFDSVVNRVSGAIGEMTGLEVIELNMFVEDVLNKADFDELRTKMGTAATAADETGYVTSAVQTPHSVRVQ